MASLTNGAIHKMFHKQCPQGFAPTLQVIDLRQIPSTDQSPADRYRLILSDGLNYQQGMLTSQLNGLVNAGQLQTYSVVRVNNFVVNNIQGKKIIIALGMEIIAPPTDGEIGSPSSIDDGQQQQSSNQNQQQPQQPAPAAQQPQQQQSYNQYNRQPQQQQSSASSRGNQSRYNMSSGGGTLDNAHVVPVASLNPFRGKWVIKVRCTSKKEVKHWNNAQGSGKLFSVDLLDGDGTEIRCTMFKEAVDKFEEVFQVDSIYLISGGRVKTANKRFTAIKNDYELTLDATAQVQPVADDQAISHQTYEFVKIAEIQNLAENNYCDVVGVVKFVDKLGSIVSKTTNKQIDKRNIQIADETSSIDVTLWAQTAEKWNEETLKDNPVVIIKAARVTEFGGRSLSLSQNSEMSVNPDHEEAYKLKGWWDTGGSGAALPTLSSSGGRSQMITDKDMWVSLSEIRDRNLGRSQDGQPDFFVSKATVTSIRYDITKPPMYLACPGQRDGRTCNKKVKPNDAGDEYWCEACTRNYPNCEPRYIMSFAVNDHTGSRWVNCFNEIGEKIMGIPAEQLRGIAQSGDDAAFTAVCDEAQFQTKLMKFKAKVETYNDEERIRLTVVALEDVDYVKESTKLIETLNSMQF